MTKYWIVGIGGFLGSIARFWLGAYISGRKQAADAACPGGWYCGM